jgi:hypothetical protein
MGCAAGESTEENHAPFTYLLACVFGLAALTANWARAEYDSGGTPTNPAQMQANRPQPYKKDQIMQRLNGGVVSISNSALADLDPQELMKLIKLIEELQPVAPKPAPAKKPIPKVPANPRPVIPRS